MTSFTLPLASPDATLERVGGKGANLARLARAEFAAWVPPGFFVTTRAYETFLQANQIRARLLAVAGSARLDDPATLDQASSEIRALFDQSPVPAEISADIAAGYRHLPHGPQDPRGLPVAVRSSATAEDLPGLSFAGQQETYLNVVGTDAVLAAVRRCWASLWTARAIAYRARNGIPSEEVALAVVVQAMIASEVSGVLFTANPLTGRRDQVVVDASFGLGEAIVAGHVEPDHYLVEARAGHILERRLGAKAMVIVPRAGGGLDHRAQPPSARQALPDPQIIELTRLGLHVAEHFGSPQDIEWAWAGERLYLLQSRPITSLYPVPGAPTAADDERIFASFNAIQGLLDPITPLGRDVLRGILAGAFRLLGIRRPTERILPEAGGRLWIDITDLARDPHLRRPLLGALARLDSGAPQALLGLIAAGRIPTRPGLTPGGVWRLAHVAPRLLGRVLQAAIAPERTRASALRSAERFVLVAREHARTAPDLAALFAALEQDSQHAFIAVVTGIFPIALPGLALMFVVDEWLTRSLGLPPGAGLRLTRGLPGNVTTQMDLRLWAVAQAIRADPPARAALLKEPAAALAEAYHRGDLPPAAYAALEGFLSAYGMRAVAEIDLGQPRWREDPTVILQTLHGYLQLEDPRLGPDAVFERGRDEAEQLTQAYAAGLRRGPLGWLRARLLRLAVQRMRALIGLREWPKFLLISILDAYRSAILEHGRRLAERGELLQAGDIFFVPLEALKRSARGEAADMRALADAGRADYARELRRRQIPRLLLSTGEAFYEGAIEAEAGADELVGDPVSPGMVEGAVRVVLDPRGARLAPGEILVCPGTDPGWTPLFLTAGGLVMEMGGMVTHGAVVAREYGIPAVVGVHQATTRLSTGQRVRLDGSRGRVTLLSS